MNDLPMGMAILEIFDRKLVTENIIWAPQGAPERWRRLVRSEPFPEPSATPVDGTAPNQTPHYYCNVTYQRYFRAWPTYHVQTTMTSPLHSHNAQNATSTYCISTLRSLELNC